MSNVSTKPPAGMRDFLPEELARRHFALDTIRRVYEGHGFEPIETPVLERIEILTGKYGEEGDQLMFKVAKRGDKLLRALAQRDPRPGDVIDHGMRYDLTVPLCRLVAEYQAQIPNVFKCFQMRPVWRADRPARGRFREFYQCDVDVVGSDSPLVEIEVVSAAARALAELGFADFAVRLNDRRLLAAMTRAAGIPEEASGQALISIDKLDKIDADGVRQELADNGFDDDTIERLFGLLGPAHPDPDTSLDRLDGMDDRLFADTSENDADRAAGQRLRGIIAALMELGLPAGRVVYDPTLVRGLAYYTGPIFEITLGDFSGSVGGGGRYDDLVGMFLGRPIPACGISLGIERILMIMEERGMFPEQLVGCDVFVTQFKNVSAVPGLRLAAQLRDRGLRVDVHPDAIRLKKQFALAEKRGTRAVVLVGPDELANGTVQMKLMSTGEQRAYTAEQAADAIAEVLGSS